MFKTNLSKILSALVVVFAVSIAYAQTAQAQEKYVAGFNLTENGGDLVYDASTDAEQLTEAQKRILEVQALGANHIILNVRATMVGGTSNEVIPVTLPAERSREAQRIKRLIHYIQSIGMTVGIRPIVFVVGSQGEFPYEEVQADGTKKVWWHGNIQPRDPNRWFESFRVFLDQYILIAKVSNADEFTIGAELYSMTVGIEDQWVQYPYGFPGRWLELLRYVRTKLPDTRLMYDINFTDASVHSVGIDKVGGELERWRYRLADLANPTDPAENKIWKDLVSFWTELDAVGIDMYRSLGSRDEKYPNDMNTLVPLLKQRSDSYATQLDNILNEIALYTNIEQIAILKEVGFRSVDYGFIDPFSYAGTGVYNEVHQAAAYDALLASFWAPKWPWFGGVNFWDIPVNPALHGKGDRGFSPLAKPLTEEIVRKYFQ